MKNERHGAVEAAAALRAIGKHAAVVSMPCLDLFERQTEYYRRTILGSAPRIAIEAGARLGLGPLDRRTRRLHRHERVRRLGAPDLYRHFGITADAVVEAAKSLAN